MNNKDENKNPWPVLPVENWRETIDTVQLWTQIVGKIRLKKMPWFNHSWHVTLYVSPKGLTTGSIPFESGIFQIEFDFTDHQLLIVSSAGKNERLALYPRSVASFYRELCQKLDQMGIGASIHTSPNEVEPAIPFEQDEQHQSYDNTCINLFWQALVKIDTVFTRFRAGFSGKCSPVHFFWGGFDLAVTRFSGREAPQHPGGAPNIPLNVMQEAYSHEVSSAGFWPGSAQAPQPVFYAYCYPTPAAFGTQPVEPPEAFYSQEMGEFFLPYDVVRQSPDPDATLMRFLQTTYDAAANTGNWDRKALEFEWPKA